MIKKILLTLFLLFYTCLFSFAEETINAKDALEKLKKGNKHFYEMHLKHPDQTIKRRLEGMGGQHPFVIILSCSDSRVSPEIIFDQGLGDIFEIRNAGNVLDEHVIASVEYAIVHLKVKLVVVMGHQNCGALKAAMEHSHESPHIENLTKALEPAIKKAKSESSDKTTLYERAIKNNATLSAENLAKSEPIISKYIKEKGVKIIPAYYHIDSGKVEFWELGQK